MNAAGPIIDVTPINSSRTRVQAQDSKTAPGVGGAHGAYGNSGGVRSGAYGGNPYGAGMYGATGGGAYAAKSSPSFIGSLAQIVVGAGLVMIGIPMLLLPGPGLLSIAAGGFLISHGLNNLRS